MTPRMKSSICNVIRMRMISEEYIFEIRALLFPFLFLSERVALRSMLGVSPRLLFTLQLSASVPWRDEQQTGTEKRELLQLEEVQNR